MSEAILQRWSNGKLPAIDGLLTMSSQEGHSFVRRMKDEWLTGVNRFDENGECLVIAFIDGTVVGMCGVNIDPFQDDPSVGRLRHLYVAPDQRRLGIGRRLVDECKDKAAERFLCLRLRTFNPNAGAFYRSIGFTVVDEPMATHSIDLDDLARTATWVETTNRRFPSKSAQPS